MIGDFYSLLSLLSLLIVFTALFAFINLRYIKLPFTIGIMVISLVCSIFLALSGVNFPYSGK